MYKIALDYMRTCALTYRPEQNMFTDTHHTATQARVGKRTTAPTPLRTVTVPLTEETYESIRDLARQQNTKPAVVLRALVEGAVAIMQPDEADETEEGTLA